MNLDDLSIEDTCEIAMSGVFYDGYWRIYNGPGCYYLISYHGSPSNFVRKVSGGWNSLHGVSVSAFALTQKGGECVK